MQTFFYPDCRICPTALFRQKGYGAEPDDRPAPQNRYTPVNGGDLLSLPGGAPGHDAAAEAEAQDAGYGSPEPPDEPPPAQD